jgi:4-hydroxy-tetrahydrodipicolinate synthase
VGFSGTWYVLPTPFSADLAVDYDSLRRTIDASLAWGVDGFLSLGVMGEPASLDDQERTLVVEATIEAAGDRAPVVVGCSAGSVTRAASLARQAAEGGAAGVMVAPPPLSRDLDVLPPFFATVSKAAALPVVIQDEPNATGVFVPVSVIVASAEAAGSDTVKLEDAPTSPKLSRLLEVRPGLSIFGGLGGINALAELRRGAVGTMTGFAFPEVLREIRLALGTGRDEAAARIFDHYLPLLVFEAQPVVGLGVRKEILRRRGVITTPITRSSQKPLDRRTAEELDDVLARCGVTPSSARLIVKDDRAPEAHPSQ